MFNEQGPSLSDLKSEINIAKNNLVSRKNIFDEQLKKAKLERANLENKLQKLTERLGELYILLKPLEGPSKDGFEETNRLVVEKSSLEIDLREVQKNLDKEAQRLWSLQSVLMDFLDKIKNLSYVPQNLNLRGCPFPQRIVILLGFLKDMEAYHAEWDLCLNNIYSTLTVVQHSLNQTEKIKNYQGVVQKLKAENNHRLQLIHPIITLLYNIQAEYERNKDLQNYISSYKEDMTKEVSHTNTVEESTAKIEAAWKNLVQNIPDLAQLKIDMNNKSKEIQKLIELLIEDSPITSEQMKIFNGDIQWFKNIYDTKSIQLFFKKMKINTTKFDSHYRKELSKMAKQLLAEYNIIQSRLEQADHYCRTHKGDLTDLSHESTEQFVHQILSGKLPVPNEDEEAPENLYHVLRDNIKNHLNKISKIQDVLKTECSGLSILDQTADSILFQKMGLKVSDTEIYSVKSFNAKKDTLFGEYEEYIKALEVRNDIYKKTVNSFYGGVSDIYSDPEIQELLNKEKNSLLRVDNRTTDNQEIPDNFMSDIQAYYKEFKYLEQNIEETKKSIENQAKITESLIKEKNNIMTTEMNIKRKLEVLNSKEENDQPKKRKIIFPKDRSLI